MPSKIQAMRSFWGARLPRRIVLWVFLSILVIEAIILLPSIYRRRQELLANLSSLTAARIEGGLLATMPLPSETELLPHLQKLIANSVVKGGSLYDASGKPIGTFGESPALKGGSLYDASGKPIGTFGESPALSIQQVLATPNVAYYDGGTGRYDVVLPIQPLQDRYVLIVRQDATSVQRELLAFIGRITLLVMLISVFVTIATLIGLERILITPILRLRSDLLKVGQAVRQDESPPEFDSLPVQRHDELGEVIIAFDQMYEQVSEAIAERKQAEAALRQSEEKFSKAFRASPSAVLISTLEDGRLIEVNDSFLKLYGGTMEEVIGKSSTELKLWASPSYRQDMIQRVRERGEVHNLEYTFQNKQGELRSILFSAELIYLNGKACLVSVANDITDRKEAEKALERLAEIGELAAMIVHEVRNPLTTVLMGLQSFRSLDLSERAQLRLTLAIEEAERLQRLLNEILQYTRCQKLDAAELELNEFIGEMLESIRAMPSAQGRQIEFTPNQTVHVLGDRDKLKQVFINLISNACEAIAEGDMVSWRIDRHPAKRTICIQIHNGGSPISTQALSQLTQPFFTTKSTGNGLGLAIVKRIVEAHQGELEIVSSEAIGGTRVSVVLPYLRISEAV